jgi:small subunit ribosomal protein S18
MGRRRRGRYVLKAEDIDYKDVQLMRRFVSERGKLVSGQRVGVSAKNQRRLARAIKRAQHLALLPMGPNHTYVTGSVQTDAAPRRADADAAPVTVDEAAEGTESDAPVVAQNNGEATESSAPSESGGSVEADSAEANTTTTN